MQTGNHSKQPTIPNKQTLIQQVTQYWEGNLSYLELIGTFTDLELTRTASGTQPGRDVSDTARAGSSEV